MSKATIVIPMGDPAGIGPEIVLKALASCNVKNRANCVVVGDKSVLEANAKICGLSPKFNVISSVDEADFSDCDVVNLIDLNNAPVESFEPGKVSGVCGKAAFEYIKAAIEIAMAKKADAVCTPPLLKLLWQKKRMLFVRLLLIRNLYGLVLCLILGILRFLVN